MWFVGHDFSDASIAAKENTKPDMEIVTRVMGVEVGYLITPIIIYYFLCAAQRNNIPNVHIMNWWLSCYF